MATFKNKRTMNEKEWVSTLVPFIQDKLKRAGGSRGVKVIVVDGRRLPYSCEVFSYKEASPVDLNTPRYETDILILDQLADGSWTPRIVIECKLQSVSTHDALTYSAKAATHKQVHPYLRYGILIGMREEYAVPGRLFRHGAHFDFMATWSAALPSKTEMSTFVSILKSEILASRCVEKLLAENRLSSRRKFAVVHRPLVMKE